MNNYDMSCNNYEPKTKHRFLVQMQDIPAFLIKSIDLHFKKIKDTDIMGKVILELYDPICPSSLAPIANYTNNTITKKIELHILGPVGDLANKYKIIIKNSSAKTKYDWSGPDEAQRIIFEADIIEFKDIIYDAPKKLTQIEKDNIIKNIGAEETTKLSKDEVFTKFKINKNSPINTSNNVKIKYKYNAKI